jgi:hypothetical protein
MRLINWFFTSWLGRIVMALALLPGFAFLYLKFSGQLNPGPVSAMQRHGEKLGGYASHAEFEKDCKHCHAPVHCITASRCQTCHLDVARQRTIGEGLHALLPDTNRCQTCHIEHKGREAVITALPMENIDHATLTGFSLAKHLVTYDGSPMTCEDCHTGGVYSAAGVTCQGCHSEDEAYALAGHVERFGGDCLLCHDGYDRMVPFTHASTLPVEGAHVQADCEACHRDRLFAGLAADCASCHVEPDYHRGQFGTDCARCHDAVAWTPAQLKTHTFHIDHAAQEALACDTCHTETYTQHTCYGCHQHDPAEVLASHEEAGVKDVTACATCHLTGEPEEVAQLRNGTAGTWIPAHEINVHQDRP